MATFVGWPMPTEGIQGDEWVRRFTRYGQAALGSVEQEVRFTGRRTYPAEKSKGKQSMCGKQGTGESVVAQDGPVRPARHGEG